MAEIEKVTAKIEADTSNFTKNLKGAAQSTTSFKKAVEKAAPGSKQLGDSFKRAAQNVAAFDGPLGPVAGRLSTVGSLLSTTTVAMVGFGAAVTGGILALKNIASAGEKFETQMLKLEAQVKVTGGAAGLSAKEINEFARDLGEATLTSAGAVRDAAGILLTFKSVSGSAFKETLSLAQDMAAVGFGSIQSATVQLAKALDDPVRGLTALRRSGVSFTESQKSMIKTLAESNDLMGAQRIILDTLAGQLGGAAVGAAQGFAGVMDTLGERFTRFFENLASNSGILGSLSTAFKNVSDGIQQLNAYMEEGATAQERFESLIQPNINLIKAYGIRLSDVDPSSLEDVNRVIKAMQLNGVDLEKTAPFQVIADKIWNQNKALIASEAQLNKLVAIYGSVGDVPEAAFAGLTTQIESQQGKLNELVESYKGLTETQDEQDAVTNTSIESLSRLEDIMLQYQSSTEKASDEILKVNALWQGGLISLEAYTEAVQKQGDVFSNLKSPELEMTAGDIEAEHFREQLGRRLEALDEAMLSEEERLLESYQNRQLLLDDKHENELLSDQEHADKLLEAQVNYEEKLKKIKDEAEKKKEKLEEKRRKGAIKNAGTFFSSLMTLTQGHNKALFNVAKAGAIATGIVNTYEAVTNAFADAPWPFNYVAAAAALVAGLAQVNSIRSTSYGGGGGGGTVGSAPSSGGGGGAGAAVPTGVAQPEVVGAGPPSAALDVNVNLGDEDEIISKRSIRIILDGLNEQIADGAQLRSINVA
jgi:hypothetical protein